MRSEFALHAHTDLSEPRTPPAMSPSFIRESAGIYARTAGPMLARQSFVRSIASEVLTQMHADKSQMHTDKNDMNRPLAASNRVAGNVPP